MSQQLSLFELPTALPATLPQGFAYQPNLIDVEEERDLVRRFTDLDFKPYEHLSYFGNRRIAGFGWRQDDNGRMVETGEALPDFLRPLLDKVAAFTGLARETFRHALVTEYASGAGIGWHRDRRPSPSPAFRCCRLAASACGARPANAGIEPRSAPRRGRPI